MRTYLTVLLLGTASIALACGGAETETTNRSNTSNTNAANVAAANTSHPVATTKTPEAATTNNAPTLGPVVQAYYAALKKKDQAAVRETMASAFLKDIEEDMKAEKKSNLAAYLAETDDPNTTIEIRNEKIEGDRGVAEIRGGVYKTWTPLAFVKENGKWKLSNESPVIRSVEQQARPR